MAPRTGQLDEISEAIGRLSGQVDSLDRYTHEREHGINNLSQKLDALGTKITRDIAAVEERIRVRFEQVEARLALLEKVSAQETGARNLATWFLQSPLIGWIAAAILFFIGWWKSVPR
jgi:predicted RNase H-like nuclease (RuvC/YqgF family)